MSDCYTVRDDNGVTRFLKVVPAGGIKADALQREMNIYDKLGRAEAKHVLQVFECKRDDDGIGLLMELADGGSLAEYVEQSDQLAMDEVKAIASSVLDGLCELHALDIVHRDLKPANVFRCGGAWKVGDFGISKNLTRLITQNRTFQGHGTSGYAPPEQWSGQGAHPTADVFAFGKMVVFLCTHETDIDMLTNPRIAHLVRRCVAFDPTARATLAEIRAGLADL
jgi:serine/threonine protein kinase